MNQDERDCVIAGGGPAGMMLGLLLARAGLSVTVLEKHADFNRDFRGDTVHPSTIRALDELGLGEKFRALKQDVLGDVSLPFGLDGSTTIGRFSALKPPYNYVALVPQWDLLEFLAHVASEESTFTLIKNARVTRVLTTTGPDPAATGVSYRDEEGEDHEIRATLTVGADGRHSIVRTEAALKTKDYPVPFDAWWFALPRATADAGEQAFSGESASEPDAAEKKPALSGKSATNTPEPAGLAPAFGADVAVLSFTRDTYFQVALLAAKGRDADFRREGIEAFRERIASIREDLAEPAKHLASMDDVYVLDVQLNRVYQWWRPGLLLIGDAAHAMSPAGGVGINLAFQDALAAARILAPALTSGTLGEAQLKGVQRRRTFPTLVVQGFQRALHRLAFGPLFAGRAPRGPRVAAWLLARVPVLAALPPRMIGFGPRPEHAPEWARPSGKAGAGSKT